MLKMVSCRKFFPPLVFFLLSSLFFLISPTSSAWANQPPTNSPDEAPIGEARAFASAPSWGLVNGEVAPETCPSTAPSARLVPSGSSVKVLCEKAVAAAPTEEAKRAIRYAFSKLGTPYSQDTKLRLTTHFDCSSFVGRAFSAAYAPVKRWNNTLVNFYNHFSWTGAYIEEGYFNSGYRYGYGGSNVVRVEKKDLKAGDIIIQFNGENPGNSAGNAGHAQIYLGDGLIIQSGGSINDVNVTSMGNYLKNEWYFRYTPSGANTTPPPSPPPVTTTPKVPLQAGSVTKVKTGVANATVMGNVTTTGASGSGFITAYPCALGRPFTSQTTYPANSNRAGFVFVKSDAAGEICFYNSSSTHLIWDQTLATITMASHGPERKVDTRLTTSPTRGALLGEGGVLKIRTGSPSKTIVGTLISTSSTSSGFLTAYPCDTTRPNVSNVNYTPSSTVSNTIAVRADSAGDICVFTSKPAHVVFDQTAETITIPSIVPSRVYDSRTMGSKAPVVAGTTMVLTTSTPDNTIFGNLTVTNPQKSGWAVVFPCAEGLPSTSSINFKPNETIANFAGVKADSKGQVCLYTTTTTHFIWDQTSSTNWYQANKPSRLVDTRN